MGGKGGVGGSPLVKVCTDIQPLCQAYSCFSIVPAPPPYTLPQKTSAAPFSTLGGDATPAAPAWSEAAGGVHGQFLELATSLIEGRMDPSAYEDDVRALLGEWKWNVAYLLVSGILLNFFIPVLCVGRGAGWGWDVSLVGLPPCAISCDCGADLRLPSRAFVPRARLPAGINSHFPCSLLPPTPPHLHLSLLSCAPPRPPLPPPPAPRPRCLQA